MTDSLANDDQASPEHCVCQIVRDYEIAVVVYTDCSATEGTRNSGAAMVATTGYPASPVIIHSEERRRLEYSLHFVVRRGERGHVHGIP